VSHTAIVYTLAAVYAAVSLWLAWFVRKNPVRLIGTVLILGMFGTCLYAIVQNAMH
jgi:hypothetical protein